MTIPGNVRSLQPPPQHCERCGPGWHATEACPALVEIRRNPDGTPAAYSFAQPDPLPEPPAEEDMDTPVVIDDTEDEDDTDLWRDLGGEGG